MSNICNIAIIAHVDHGKTTLIDNMLKQSGTFRNNQKFENRIMDCNDIERERGITITAKCTSMFYKGIKYNIIDTPGHGDFGGEVERILSMADGAILLVDSSEGPMPQTKFVLSKALENGLKPIVLINKIDKAENRADFVLDEIFDLFCSLNANDQQLEFPVLYAIGRNGLAAEKNIIGKNLEPLFKVMSKYVPKTNKKKLLPFSMLASILTPDKFLGRVLIGKVYSGSAKIGDNIKSINLKGKFIENIKLTNLFGFEGVKRVPITIAETGDIVAIAGVQKTSVSDTICNNSINTPIKSNSISSPTMSITIGVNDSPLSGVDGSKITSRIILERLEKEVENNIAVTLKILGNGEKFQISGRGELQLGIIIEKMRREGFELSVSRPKVLLKKDIFNNILEPIEEVMIDINDIYSSVIINKLLIRKAELKDINSYNGKKTRIIFHIPSRGLIGYDREFKNDTKGTGTLSRNFYSYQKYKGKFASRKNGVLISNTNGEASAYALFNIENRGNLFIHPKTKVYEGMIIGEHCRNNDLEVNPIKCKQLTNTRAIGNSENIRLTPPKALSLEENLSYIENDELIEVTPKNIRLRKIILSSQNRKKSSKDKDIISW